MPARGQGPVQAGLSGEGAPGQALSFSFLKIEQQGPQPKIVELKAFSSPAENSNFTPALPIPFSGWGDHVSTNPTALY